MVQSKSNSCEKFQAFITVSIKHLVGFRSNEFYDFRKNMAGRRVTNNNSKLITLQYNCRKEIIFEIVCFCLEERDSTFLNTSCSIGVLFLGIN